MPTRVMNNGVDEIYKDQMLKKVAFKDVKGDDQEQNGFVKNSIFSDNSCSEESSSSIGKNSDVSEEKSEGDGEEEELLQRTLGCYGSLGASFANKAGHLEILEW